MTRLFYGSTFLASLCAMTLIVGCGGSSSPGTTTCDGAIAAMQGDTGSKLDVPRIRRLPNWMAQLPLPTARRLSLTTARSLSLPTARLLSLPTAGCCHS